MSIRDDALGTARARGVRSGQLLGNNPGSKARVGWLKLFADGALTSRTAALLEDYEEEPGRPLPDNRRRGVWMTEPAQLEELVRYAAGAGIMPRSTRSATRRSALRSTCSKASAIPAAGSG